MAIGFESMENQQTKLRDHWSKHLGSVGLKNALSSASFNAAQDTVVNNHDFDDKNQLKVHLEWTFQFWTQPAPAKPRGLSFFLHDWEI